MGGYMRDFSYLETISIEIGSDCNLKKIHTVCPANVMSRSDKDILSVEEVCKVMDEAVDNGFKGLFAFHFYNEPLIYIERISDVMQRRPQYKYLLWSNGILVNKVNEEGFDFNLFEKIVFTCYDKKYNEILLSLKETHRETQIFQPEMDDRLNIYTAEEMKQLSCKKMKVELPIDCEGNVYICTFDYKKEFLLGNIREQSLLSIINSQQYIQYFDAHSKLLMSDNACELCRKCRRVYRNKT
jgi:radical SAM protein with 4Fe4S-binding SPASM domain